MTPGMRLTVGTIAVAKKSARKGPKPNPAGRRDALVTFKCYRAYKDWLADYADSKRVTPAQLIDLSLLRMAESEGHPQPPKR